MKIGVFQDEGSDFMRRLKSQVKTLGSAEFTLEPEGDDYDVIIWQKTAPDTGRAPAYGRVLICGGDDRSAALARCGCGQMITIGSSRADTFALSSSVMHRGGMATLQHEVKDLKGNTVSPQEMYLDGFTGTMPEKMAMKACEIVSNICL